MVSSTVTREVRKGNAMLRSDEKDKEKEKLSIRSRKRKFKVLISFHLPSFGLKPSALADGDQQQTSLRLLSYTSIFPRSHDVKNMCRNFVYQACCQ